MIDFLSLSERSKSYMRYEIANEDTASDPQYFGYINMHGAWLIQKRAVSTGIYTYAQGSSDYSTNWTGRAGLSYGAYSTLKPIIN